MGGLGNQLFQAAAGIALSSLHNTELKFYFQDHYKLAKRSYALSPFDLDIKIAKKNEVEAYLPKTKISRKIYQVLGKNPDAKLFREPEHFRYYSNFFSLPDDIYLSGFWQSYKYFENYTGKIQKSFEVRTPLEGRNKKVSERISSSKNSVSLHIRRGDYTNPNSGFYCLPISYYNKAIQKLSDQFEDIKLFVFSDDISWAQQSIKQDNNTLFVDHNDLNSAHEDLRLMTKCKHSIIANSSLSWWGAYLNSYQKKTVIAPKKWTHEISVNHMDLIPSGWVII